MYLLKTTVAVTKFRLAYFFASATRQGLGTANKQPVQSAMKEVDQMSKSNAKFCCFCQNFYFFSDLTH